MALILTLQLTGDRPVGFVCFVTMLYEVLLFVYVYLRFVYLVLLPSAAFFSEVNSTMQKIDGNLYLHYVSVLL